MEKTFGCPRYLFLWYNSQLKEQILQQITNTEKMCQLYSKINMKMKKINYRSLEYITQRYESTNISQLITKHYFITEIILNNTKKIIRENQ